MFTSTGDIFGKWKEYLENLLNPNVTSPVEGVGAGDPAADSSIAGAEITAVVQKPLDGGAPGVDEIHLSTSSLWML